MTPQLPSTQHVGDGAEYFVAAMLNLHAVSCAKMPAGWTGYDLIADTEAGPQRIQVKAKDARRAEWNRSDSMRFWEPGKTGLYDWLAIVLCDEAPSEPRVWLIPADVVEQHRHRSKTREILFSTIQGPLSRFENNWSLSRRES